MNNPYAQPTSPWINLSQESVTATTQIISSVEDTQRAAAINQAAQTAQDQKTASDIETARIQAQKSADTEISASGSSTDQGSTLGNMPTWGKVVAITVGLAALGGATYFIARPRKSIGSGSSSDSRRKKKE